MDKIKTPWIVITIIFHTVALLQAQQSSGVYDYPIKPGTEEWKNIISHEQMIEVCQIPGEILKSMSTIDLIETCLNYPLYGNMFVYDQLQMGFESVTRNFNGLKELLKREDASIILLEKYKEMDPVAFEQDWTLSEKGNYARKFYSIEILIAQQEILSKLQKIQRKSLIEECIRKAVEKGKYPEVYGIQSLRNIWLITGRIMMDENFEPLIKKIETDERIKIFIQVGSIPDVISVRELLNFSVQYLSEKNEGGNNHEFK